jgi:hypothetical protein
LSPWRCHALQVWCVPRWRAAYVYCKRFVYISARLCTDIIKYRSLCVGLLDDEAPCCSSRSEKLLKFHAASLTLGMMGRSHLITNWHRAACGLTNTCTSITRLQSSGCKQTATLIQGMVVVLWSMLLAFVPAIHLQPMSDV